MLQKIYLPLLVSVFEELSDQKGIFQIGVQNQLIFQKIQSLKKIRQFENFKNLSSWIQFLERISTYKWQNISEMLSVSWSNFILEIQCKRNLGQFEEVACAFFALDCNITRKHSIHEEIFLNFSKWQIFFNSWLFIGRSSFSAKSADIVLRFEKFFSQLKDLQKLMEAMENRLFEALMVSELYVIYGKKDCLKNS